MGKGATKSKAFLAYSHAYVIIARTVKLCGLHKTTLLRTINTKIVDVYSTRDTGCSIRELDVDPQRDDDASSMST